MALSGGPPCAFSYTPRNAKNADAIQTTPRIICPRPRVADIHVHLLFKSRATGTSMLQPWSNGNARCWQIDALSPQRSIGGWECSSLRCFRYGVRYATCVPGEAVKKTCMCLVACIYSWNVHQNSIEHLIIERRYAQYVLRAVKEMYIKIHCTIHMLLFALHVICKCFEEERCCRKILGRKFQSFWQRHQQKNVPFVFSSSPPGLWKAIRAMFHRFLNLAYDHRPIIFCLQAPARWKWLDQEIWDGKFWMSRGLQSLPAHFLIRMLA